MLRLERGQRVGVGPPGSPIEVAETRLNPGVERKLKSKS